MRTREQTKNAGIKISIIIALLSLAMSLYNFWDANFREHVDVIAGRQARLYVVIEPGKSDTVLPQPCILMTLAFVNSGGCTASLTDVKLDVSLVHGAGPKEIIRFKALREVENILEDGDRFAQNPISPIVIIAKSSEVRQYAFVPSENVTQSEVPYTFDLLVTISVQDKGEWISHRSYKSTGIFGVWQDLGSPDIFQAAVIDLTESAI